MKTGRHLCIVIALLGILLLAPGSIRAELKTWDGGGDGTSWADGDNWSPNGVPDAGVDDIAIVTNATIDLGTTRNVASRVVTLKGCTIRNGTLDFVNAWNPGWLYANDATFTDGAALSFGVPQTVVLSNTVVNIPAWASLIQYGASYTVIGGSYYAGNVHGVFGDRGTARLTIDGGTNTTIIGALRANSYHAAFGPMTPAGDAIFTMTNNPSIRLYTSHPVALGVGTDGSGLGVVNLDSGTLRADSGILFGSNAILRVGASGTRMLYYQGPALGISNFMTSAASFDGEGLTLRFWPEVAPAPYEVGGTDRGAVLAGFHDNYSLLNIEVGTYFPGPMKLTDAANNDGQAGSEALYVDEITHDGNFTFDLNGLNLYYKKLKANAGTLTVNNGSLTQVTGASLVPAAPYVHAPEGGWRFTAGDAPLSIGTDYGTVTVGGFPNGATVLVSLQVSGSQTDIDALRTELGGRGSGNRIRVAYPQAAVGNDLFFDWNFSHRGVTNVTFEASKIKGTLISMW